MSARYLLAIPIPEPFNSLLEGMQERFRVPAWKSNLPPHITVVPPFSLKQTVAEQELIRELNTFKRQLRPFIVQIDGVDQFTNERMTIYAKVVSSPALEGLRAALLKMVRAQAATDPINFPSYVPHVTLSNQLTAEQAARQFRPMESMRIRDSFQCQGFSMYRQLTDDVWDEVK